MRISVKSYLNLSQYTAHLSEGSRLEVAEGACVADVLELLQIPSALRQGLLLFVNGRPSRPERVLVEQDTLVFFQPMAGG